MIKIGIDLDGVLGENDHATCHELNKRFGTTFGPEDLTEYDHLAHLIRAHTEDPRAALAELWDNADFLKRIPFILPGLPACRRIRGMVDELHIVTARSATTRVPEAIAATRWWLDRHGVPYDVIAHVLTKTAYCQHHRIDFLVEDAPHTALEAAKAGIRVWLVDKPYNRHVMEGATGIGRGCITRVPDIGLVPDLLGRQLNDLRRTTEGRL